MKICSRQERLAVGGSEGRFSGRWSDYGEFSPVEFVTKTEIPSSRSSKNWGWFRSFGQLRNLLHTPITGGTFTIDGVFNITNLSMTLQELLDEINQPVLGRRRNPEVILPDNHVCDASSDEFLSTRWKTSGTIVLYLFFVFDRYFKFLSWGA